MAPGVDPPRDAGECRVGGRPRGRRRSDRDSVHRGCRRRAPRSGAGWPGVLVLVRSGCLVLAEATAQEAASTVKAAHRLHIGGLLRGRHPAAALVTRSGELVHVVTADVERLDGYVARFLPARATAVTVPLLIVAVIAVIDPLTLPILLFAGPLLVILLGLIGRTTAARTRRRERELAWLDGHFLDMIRGLPTLRLFGRSHEQVDAIERVARQLAAELARRAADGLPDLAGPRVGRDRGDGPGRDHGQRPADGRRPRRSTGRWRCCC